TIPIAAWLFLFVDMLLDKIAAVQVKETGFHEAGLFPSQIVWPSERKVVEDNNIFFTALIVYTLQSIKSTMPVEDQALIDRISAKARPTFFQYQNRQGGPTYNFYPVRPENPFPGFRFLPRFEFAKLPDDLDCTAMIWLAQSSTPETDRQVKQLMADQSSRSDRISSTFPAYRQSRAYRTWFATKMKQDLDVAVNCNVLTFVFEKGLPLDAVDAAAIDFIVQVVRSGQHVHQGHLVSSYYQSPTVILYHLARLIAVADHPDLNSLRETVIADLKAMLTAADNALEQVILLTSLHRLQAPVAFEIDLARLERDMPHFYWFRTNFLCGYPFWVKRLFGKEHFVNYRNQCEAYGWCLALELKQLANATMENTGGGQPTSLKRQ
ncbi:MAG: hypothetical protein AAGB22_04920, partial [Bacteroidota bacterium]